MVEPWFVVPVVVGSNPIIHPEFARVAELVDALVLGTSTYGVRVRVSPLVNFKILNYGKNLSKRIQTEA